MHVFLGMGLLFVLPMGIDGFTQLLTDYESTNPIRVITGLIFGTGLGLFFASSLSARPQDFEDGAGQVVLPGGARFLPHPTEDE